MSNIADSNNEPPPVPPTIIPSVVDTLDPDLAAAYRSGNPTIIQAVNAGMTTNAMIINEVIRMGGGMTGLPPAVQAMVAERQKEMAEQAAAENARLAKLAAGVIGLGLMATNIAQGGEYYGGEGTASRNYFTSPPSSQEFASWDSAQRLAYYDQRQAMTLDQWDAIGTGARQEHHTRDVEHGDSEMNANVERMQDLYREMKANLTPEQMQVVYGVVENLPVGTDVGSPEGRRLMQEQAAKLSRENPSIPTHYFERYAEYQEAVLDGAAIASAGYAGQAANQAGNVSTSHTAQQTAAAIAAELERKKLAKTLDQRTDLDRQVDSIMAAAGDKGGAKPFDTKGEIRAAGVDSLESRAKADGTVAKAEKRADLADGGGLEEETPQVASAAPRLTINAQPLAAAGQLQPEGVVAANDPKGPEPEQQRPRVATPSQGMGA